ncbi:HigA family addiction module antitoxin [Parvibaculum sp.]|jgi:addiction module HigA family antidote|uniref:HigA family addiction module antitoxin n=1 Tax=Parvibaculum sp. TaxID=2024848 RepID=UPI003487962E
MAKIAPIHPGEVLAEDFMKPLGLSANALAQKLGVPANRISAIVGGRRDISPDTALRLERAFGSSAEFWLSLQARYDLETARDQIDKKELLSIKAIQAA